MFYLAWETEDPEDPTRPILASMLTRLVRPYDAIVPLGDGRFVLILPQVGETGADIVAARLVQELRVLASVCLTSSEAALPRITLAGPTEASRLLAAAIEAAEMAPPWRGDRAQLLRVGVAVLERSEPLLGGALMAGTIVKLKPRDERALRAQILDAESLRLKILDSTFRLPGERLTLILEKGRTWMRGEVEIQEVSGAELRLAPPRRIYRVPRRQTERFRLRLPVRLADLEGMTLNLSADGFRAVFPVRAFSPGQVVEGCLELPGGDHAVRIEVIKVRTTATPEGMVLGCRFVGLDEDARNGLTEVLNRQVQAT